VAADRDFLSIYNLLISGLTIMPLTLIKE